VNVSERRAPSSIQGVSSERRYAYACRYSGRKSSTAKSIVNHSPYGTASFSGTTRGGGPQRFVSAPLHAGEDGR
jgi:hypothetical protein